MYATVVIDISSKQLNRLFDYKVPASLYNKVKKGMRVVVDFNNRISLAYVVDIVKTSKYSTKEVLYVLDEKPTLSNIQLKLIDYLQTKSFSTYIDAFQTVVPTALQAKYEYKYQVVNKEQLDQKLKELIKNDYIDLKNVQEEDFKSFNNAVTKGYLLKQTIIKDKIKATKTKRVFINKINQKLTNKQQLIINDLIKPKLIEELESLGHSKNIILRLINKKVLNFEFVDKYKTYEQKFNLDEENVILNKDQKDVINKIDLNSDQKYLLYGPPASGKTEVYLRLIKEVLKKGKQALILVPEISLIPQMTSRIKNRFNDDVAVYHSALTAKTRYDNYRKVKDGLAKIIVGTRSSVFLPIEKLGLIILDEAHDLSYIQKVEPYYDTKDIAKLLSDLKKCPLIFGTATPTVSLFYEAKLGKLNLLELKEQVHKPNVNIKVIDMKEELVKGNISMFSDDLKYAISNTLKANKQIVILVNRRGYAPFVLCRTCGHVSKCPNCNISLVYHKNENALKCHSCGYKSNYESTCTICKNKTVKPVGFGTEQVEEELLKEFKDIKVLRMDSDTTSKRGSHDEILTKFLNHEADLLLGTQMVSKGHHFENVSLVSVLLADQMLNLSSYLANEKTYNLLTQHIGRIRNSDGLAVIQAYNVDHFVLKSVLKKDYYLYFKEELETRRLLNLTPFYNVVKITFKGKESESTYRALTGLKNNFLAKNSQIKAFGPSENYIFYSNNRYNYSVVFKIPLSFKIDNIMNYFDRKYTKDYYIDIDYYPDEI